jgi:hypothetical protein
MSVPVIHDWHNPRAFNPDAPDFCPHNLDITRDCTCKRKVNRKPYRVVRVSDPTAANYQRDGRIVVEVHPNGLLVFRERGRRKQYSTTVGKIYSNLIWHEAMTLRRRTGLHQHR